MTDSNLKLISPALIVMQRSILERVISLANLHLGIMGISFTWFHFDITGNLNQA